MSPAECNYGIGDKELLAIINALEKWHIYLHALPRPFLVLTDHHNLQTFRTKQLLIRRQACWAGFLTQYDFVIQLRPGKANGKADALTRRSGDLPREGDSRSRPIKTLLLAKKFFLTPSEKPFSEPSNLEPSNSSKSSDSSDSSKSSSLSLAAAAISLNHDIQEALTKDELAQDIIQGLANGLRRYLKVPTGESEFRNGLLYIHGLLYVPDNLELQSCILKSCHDHCYRVTYSGSMSRSM